MLLNLVRLTAPTGGNRQHQSTWGKRSQSGRKTTVGTELRKQRHICIWIDARIYLLRRRTLGRSTHRGTNVLDSLRYELKALGSGQVPLLSDILADIAESAHKNILIPVRMNN